MYIAVTSEGNKLTDKVSQYFGLCKYLLIVKMPDLSVNAIKNESSEEELSKKVMDFDCEAVITGNLSQSAFDILADACITRYFGYGNSAEEALVLMENNSLKLIRNVNGTDECSGDHH